MKPGRVNYSLEKELLNSFQFRVLSFQKLLLLKTENRQLKTVPYFYSAPSSFRFSSRRPRDNLDLTVPMLIESAAAHSS